MLQDYGGGVPFTPTVHACGDQHGDNFVVTLWPPPPVTTRQNNFATPFKSDEFGSAERHVTQLSHRKMNGAKQVAALVVAVMLCCALVAAVTTESAERTAMSPDDDQRKLMDAIDGVFDAADAYRLAPGVRVKRSTDARPATAVRPSDRDDDPEKYLYDRIARFAGTHVLDVNFSEMFQSAGRSFVNLIPLREYTQHDNSGWL